MRCCSVNCELREGSYSVLVERLDGVLSDVADVDSDVVIPKAFDGSAGDLSSELSVLL